MLLAVFLTVSVRVLNPNIDTAMSHDAGSSNFLLLVGNDVFLVSYSPQCTI
jgi:hypothetical protein